MDNCAQGNMQNNTQGNTQEIIDNIYKELKVHQKEAIRQSAEMDAFAYLMDMGTGKTLCDIVDTLKSQAYPWLIITRNGVKINWAREIQKWTGHADTVLLEGTLNKKVSLLNAGMKRGDRYYILNFESLRGMSAHLIKYRWGKLSLDESSSVKSPTAVCTNYANVVRQQAQRVRLLTGTPTGGSPLDLFSQFYILNPAILGFYPRPRSKKPISSAFYPFKHAHAEIELQYHYNRKHESIRRDDSGRPIYKNVDVILQKIAPYSFTIKKEDCLDLPEQVIMSRYVDMHEEQERIYKELAAESVADIPENETMSVANALARMVRLQQVLGGNVVLDEDRGERRIPENKTSAVFDILEEIGDNKAVVWCRFKAEIKYLQSELNRAGYNVLTYYGDTEDRDETYGQILAGNYDVVVANAQSGGLGLDFTTANYSIYYSRSFNLIEYQQSRDRIYRMGQNKKVTQIILITNGTLEVMLDKSLAEKKSFSDFFTDTAATSGGREALRLILNGG
ncbi:MAG TPA: DEAD/DEAH box helicase [Candidatus Goldiibacteriota bacterium]|nr:DEAD/DEAH box helicase [Candidatus Goldiibacteriota bacterium]